MIKYLFIIVFLFSPLGFAGVENTEELKNYYEADIILKNIEQLQEDGFITERNAIDAKNKYVFENEELIQKMVKYNEDKEAQTYNVDSDVSITEYFTLVNTIKFIACLAFIIAFHGIFAKIIKNFYKFITLIPNFFYQAVLLSLSVTLTLNPSLLFDSQAFYIALVSSFINIFILGWFIADYRYSIIRYMKFLFVGIKPEILIGFYTFLYFGGLSILYTSSFFGLLSVMGFVGMLGFIFLYSDLIAIIGVEDEKEIHNVTFTTLFILGIYSAVRIFNIEVPYLESFYIGIEYVCSIALGVCLLIGSSIYIYEGRRKSFPKGLYTVMFVLVTIASMGISTLYGITVPSAIITTFFALYILGNIGYMTSKVNYIFMTFVLGAMLYGTALLMEKYPAYFVTSLF